MTKYHDETQKKDLLKPIISVDESMTIKDGREYSNGQAGKALEQSLDTYTLI